MVSLASVSVRVGGELLLAWCPTLLPLWAVTMQSRLGVKLQGCMLHVMKLMSADRELHTCAPAACVVRI